MGEVAVLRTGQPIPDEALNSHVGILGKTGSGKSYTARGLAERLLRLHRQVVIVDPTGAWYGLRTGFEVPIFGGRHGDVAIGDLAGDAVASVIVEKQASAIIDLSLMTANGQKRFMRDFAHRLRQKPPGALYLFLDEADEFLPQEKVKGSGGAATDTNLFGDLKWMVRRGRLNGFRVTMITQRPAEIAKAVLTQIETLVAHRLTGPQDRRAVEEWVKGHADPDAHKEVLSSLASLEKGVAWVWAPELDLLTKSKMPKIETFDSGRTPEPGEVEVKPPALADLDLSAIDASLAAVVEEAKANDPRTLKAEVARLTRELAAAQKGVAPAWPDQREEVDGLLAELRDAQIVMDGITRGAVELQRRQKKALAALSGEEMELPPVSAVPVAMTPPRRVAPAPAPVQRQPISAREPRQSEGDGALKGPQRQMLQAIAWWAAMGHATPSKAQVAAISGWRITSGHLKNVAGSLRTLGLIDYPSPGLFTLTEDGRAAAPEPDMGASFHDNLRGTLTGPQKAVFDHLLATGGELTRDELARALGWEPTSGHVKNVLGSMRTLELLDYPSPGIVALQAWAANA